MSLQSRYTVLKKIADGGTAEIFLAKQSGAQGFEKMVVLKRIFTTFYADPQFRHMLVDEAHIAMSLYHSNIVQILDLGEADGRYFLAFELVDGWSLDEVLRRSRHAGVPFPPALALYVTAEVCRALAYAHAKSRDGRPLGIVHRDVSPHNVLLSEHGEVKLTDFGIAKAQNKKGQSLGNIIKGKIAFMSPEQASGSEIDARSDLFSLGTMLYVMITRRYPFEAATDYETLMLVKSGNFAPPETARPALNPEIYRVIRRAMGKQPADRYQDAGAMLVDVEQVMRVAFRAVGQTELARWLTDLSAKDGVPPLTRTPVKGEAATVMLGPGGPSQSGVQGTPDAAQGGSQAGSEDGQESGLVLDVDDAEEMITTSVNHAAPPPVPAAEPSVPVPSLRPPAPWQDPQLRRAAVRIGGVALLVLLGIVSVKTLVRRGPPPPRLDAPPAAATNLAAAPPAPAPPPAPATAPQPSVAPEAGSAAAATAEPAGPQRPDASPAAATAGQAVAGREEPAAEPPAAAPGDEPEPEQEAADEVPGPGKEGRKAGGKKQVSVLLKSDPEGSKVSTRHHSFGATPISLRLQPGNSYQLTFTKPGYLAGTKVVRVTSQTRALTVTLKRAKAAAPAPPAAATTPEPNAAAADSKKSWWKLRFAR